MFDVVMEELRKKDRTIYWLADKIHCSTSTLYDWKNHNRKPKIDKLMAISNELDIPISKLIEGENNGINDL